jgi:V-type H+-transporting ATPase proteolipid subunit
LQTPHLSAAGLTSGRLHLLACSIIFCEAVAIYGVIVAIILQTKLENISVEKGLYSRSNMSAGYAIFGAGLTCGFSNLVCG